MTITLVGSTSFLDLLLLNSVDLFLFSPSCGPVSLSDSPGRPSCSSLYNNTVSAASYTTTNSYLSFIPFTSVTYTFTIMHLFTTLAFTLLAPSLFDSTFLSSAGSTSGLVLATPTKHTPPGGKKWLPYGLEKWMRDEETVALRGVLNNIGCKSGKVKGAGCGIVVASPSKKDPDCEYQVFISLFQVVPNIYQHTTDFFTWTRDAALTMQMIIYEYIFGNHTLEPYIEDYIHSQAILQTVSSPSGTLLPDGLGLAEPKFLVDSTKFNAPWGRPQRDGPALRAIALITYCKHLVEEKGQRNKAKMIIWPIIQNDISYVGQYWNQTGFDLWEEVRGSSFFTIQNQHRALIEAQELASMLDEKCTGCDQAPNVLQMLQYFWSNEYIDSNINVDEKRAGLDGNTIVGPISVFDIEASCKGKTFQPCNSKVLATFKKLVDSFREEYPINKGAEPGQGVAIGRYKEDVYYGGQPWYLLTFGAAELLYDAIAQWEYQKFIEVDTTSLPFFKEIYPVSSIGTYPAKGGKYSHFAKMTRAVRDYADSFIQVAREYTPEDGSLSEQYSRDDGKPMSAKDLTWSYASFMTMARRREGAYPRSWNSSCSYLPGEGPTGQESGSRSGHHGSGCGSHGSEGGKGCSSYQGSGSTGRSHGGSSDSSSGHKKRQDDGSNGGYPALWTKGVYAPAIAAGAPNVSGPCQIEVRFKVTAATYYGENIYVIGSIPALGNWDVNGAVPLDAAEYTSEHPLWRGTAFLDAAKEGQTNVVKYHYVRQQDDKWVKENIEREISIGSCGSGVVSTEDSWTGPIVATKRHDDDDKGSSRHCASSSSGHGG